VAAVYSTRFLQAHGLSGTTTYTVPAGYRAVLVQLDTYSNPLLALEVFLHGALGQAMWWGQWTPTIPQYQHWAGRQVIEAGESVDVEVNAGPGDGADVTLSGYLLTLP